ncbi:MAG: EpsG family protein [Bacteroidetes bacterium]|nr:EpsG family protein [Bacteroidota bacterium]
MITILYIFFAVISFLIIFRAKNQKIKLGLLIVLAILLIVNAALRPSDVAKDYEVYTYYWRLKFLEDVEISFIQIRNLLKYVLQLGPGSLFIVYAVLGVSAKVYSIKLFTKYVFLSLLIYLSHYYILHELTQIRVGVASGFFLIGVYYLAQRNLVKFLIFTLIGGYFHYSAFLALPLWFLYNDQRKISIYAILIPLGYFIYLAGSNLIVSLPIPYVQEKVRVYEELRDMGFEDTDKINVFNAVFLMRILIFFVLFFFRKRIAAENPYIYILLKIYAISLFTFTALASIPAFAFRIQELFGVVEILLFPSLAFIFKDRIFGYSLVILLALAVLSIDIFYGKLILY